MTTSLPILEERGLLLGDATFFNLGLGSCGKQNTDKDLAVALSSKLMSTGDYCGKKIKVVTDDGKEVICKVVDTCPSCSRNSIDLSPAAFKKLASLDKGRFKVKWSFI
ncbi:RlpA-like double-psi beta-barrel-protein domain-containing protein-containing protein [Cunninghamella echinulata]|nr:RlpA-like double-psi beta-barrel-protein domain-containing protein-containing protein [Cunninghamella echinulata]